MTEWICFSFLEGEWVSICHHGVKRVKDSSDRVYWAKNDMESNYMISEDLYVQFFKIYLCPIFQNLFSRIDLYNFSQSSGSVAIIS